MSKNNSRRDARRRDLAQNFLVDTRAVAKVLHIAEVRRGDLVVDLGAGRGALAVPLAEAGADVMAVELDPRWTEVLRDAARSTPGLRVVHADLRSVELPVTPFRVVASPPYNLSTAVVRRLMTLDLPLRDATLVLQRQTALRFTTTGKVSRFALTWAPWFDLQVRASIRRECFRPMPASESAVLTIRSREVAWVSPARFAAWSGFVDGLFDANGRTLAERWATLHGRRSVPAAARTSGVDLARPPSRVSAGEWLTLFRSLPEPQRR